MSHRHLTTVTLNAAIDKTYFMPAIAAGRSNRVARVIAQPGGKGLNVARVVRLLGEQVVAAGIVGGDNGAYIEQELTRQGIRHDFIRVDGESRICLNVIPETGEAFELLEPGPEICRQEIDALLSKLDRLAETSSVIVLSGSVPAGCPPQIYEEIVSRLAPWETPVILDTSGAPLAHGVRARPYMIKPNQEEMAALSGASSAVEDRQAMLASIFKLMEDGIRCVAATLGEHGALIGLDGEIYRMDAIPVQPVNTVGCGDAFVAGMAVGLHRGLPYEDCMKLAIACSASNALHDAAGVIDPVQAADIARLVRIEPV